ncbi:formyl transferase [Phakopsora pachyrhizi]|uniref:methionyl-tRNA formyltransferase n=1 Tax=Phakopsora pachyrhizi TaxID=170000 RepID=A0AAV0BNN1_PHAPC|nr:formyl transferase [Phakopsora pachyrhizi]CAH7687815.1 formyl transferase [Phakopsora pachyrhizi]
MIFDMRIDLFVKKDLRIYRRIFLKGLGVQSTFSRNLFSSTNSKDQKSDNTFDEVVKKIRVENRLKVLFFGSDTFSSKVFKKLFDSKDLWNQMFVVTPPISKRGRGQREIHKPPLLELAEELNVNFQSLSRSGKDALNEFQETGFQDDTVLITASFPYFIPSPIISSFQTSFCLNVHPSLLPLYRGPAPIQWQIYNQEQNSGVTVQDLSSKGFDLGKILAQRHVPLPKNSGYYEVESFFAEASGELLCEVLANLKSHAKFAKDQDSSKASYAPKVNLNHSKINSKSSFNHVRSKFHAFSHRVESIFTPLLPHKFVSL